MGTMLGRVLVIDDDPFMLKVICDLLNKAGFRVVVQQSAVGATQVIVRERIDAAVIDWNLPIVQGDDVVRLLRSWDEIKNLPILLITGAPQETIQRIRQELPGVHVLSKEVLRQQLVATLGAVVGSNKTMRDLKAIRIGEDADDDDELSSASIREGDLVPQLLSQLGDTMPLAGQAFSEALKGHPERVELVTQTLELLAGQARLLALEEAASLIQALTDTMRAVPGDKKVPRDVRRAVEGGIQALSALALGTDGAFTVPPEPLIGALRRAREDLTVQS